MRFCQQAFSYVQVKQEVDADSGRWCAWVCVCVFVFVLVFVCVCVNARLHVES